MTQIQYEEFLKSKQIRAPSVGREVPPEHLADALFPFQRALTHWSLRKGRAALWADTGLGKTPMQLAWAKAAADRALIVAPLGVTHQTVEMAGLVDADAVYARSEAEAPTSGIVVTNYEMVQHFDPSKYGAVVLDESGILKSFDGALRNRLIEMFRDVPMRLACTATPAPNDIAEIANHAEFLGVMSRRDVLATFFTHDDTGWRLKRPARQAFYRWLASWGMSVKKPSDIGYSDEGYELPPLTIKPVIVDSDYRPEGMLFATGLGGIQDRSYVRKSTLAERVRRAAEIIQAEPDEKWLAWVGLNDEGRELARMLPSHVLLEGSQTPEEKVRRTHAFLDPAGPRVMISKARISGYGLNLQNCARQVYVGIGDSYEQYYQCLRRSHRFKQDRPVHAYIVLTDIESEIYENVLRKEREADALSRELIAHVREFERAEIGTGAQVFDYQPTEVMEVPSWLQSA
jgi:hypothetical protein